ncbi:MAG: diacylglycerol kinase family lipid kinase [Prevotellaceae bacterium]|jgi:YegS/Rv2252/BmrU family lipid kinase|nr:diacylglycerol kinase family lipid kinase [Prevotellaceae bacterium]
MNSMTERRKIVFIVNPNSGTVNKSNWIALASKLLVNEFDLEFKYATSYIRVGELARYAVKDGVHCVVAVGGDGTVNEIANVLRHTETALAILPLGSGNGLARDLRISTLLPFKALEAIRRQKSLLIDYGTVNDVPFFCTCGIGLDALVSNLFAESKRRGFLSYTAIAIREYFRCTPIDCTLTYDGQTHKKQAVIINCANIRQFGYNAYIAPQADFQDGLMNVTILKPFGLLMAVHLAWKLFTKTIDTSRYAETFTCRELRVEMPSETYFHYDGEPTSMPSVIDIKIIPRGLRVIVP